MWSLPIAVVARRRRRSRSGPPSDPSARTSTHATNVNSLAFRRCVKTPPPFHDAVQLPPEHFKTEQEQSRPNPLGLGPQRHEIASGSLRNVESTWARATVVAETHWRVPSPKPSVRWPAPWVLTWPCSWAQRPPVYRPVTARVRRAHQPGRGGETVGRAAGGGRCDEDVVTGPVSATPKRSRTCAATSGDVQVQALNVSC